jgi:predicted transposase/invertase (TIGR01784 family)
MYRDHNLALSTHHFRAFFCTLRCMKSDSLFYKYFQLLPEALLLLAGEDISALQNVSEYRFQSIEVKDLSFRLDGVLAMADYQGTFYFVEVQYQKDKRLYRRILAEIMVFLYQQEPQGNWRMVVIFPKRSIDAGAPQDAQEYIATGRLKIVYLDELPREVISAFPLNLLQIVLAPANANDVAEAVNAVLLREETTQRRDDVLHLVRGMIAAKLPTLTYEEIRAMIEPTFTELEQTQYYKDLQAMKEQMRQEGLQEGRQEGRQEGLQQGERRKQESTAKKLLVMGLSVEQVAEATELSIEEIHALQSKN